MAGINLNVSLLGGQHIPIKSSIYSRQSGEHGNDALAGLNAQAGPAYQLELSLNSGRVDETNPEIREMKRSGKIACKTCQSRQYQDQSNDAGVSFKSPAHIAPENAASIVQAHEQEHISNAQNRSLEENSEVVSQSVKLYSAICQECGRSYIAGGEARTVTVKSQQASPKGLGGNIDLLM